ncbi:MAG: hypothetical protein C0606_02145 [Hyphomicrobiales bacterium]|nr:MAG: hypothetical protein C0606_02145 [Hyphomicrobiales bacterium]
MSKIRFRNTTVKLPASRMVRMIIGFSLILGGLLGFLPVLGFWMIPLGVLVLSVDLAPVRRLRRRVEVWWEKRRRANGKVPTNESRAVSNK